jgi:hypothetical protein
LADEKGRSITAPIIIEDATAVSLQILTESSMPSIWLQKIISAAYYGYHHTGTWRTPLSTPLALKERNRKFTTYQ